MDDSEGGTGPGASEAGVKQTLLRLHRRRGDFLSREFTVKLGIGLSACTQGLIRYFLL